MHNGSLKGKFVFKTLKLYLTRKYFHIFEKNKHEIIFIESLYIRFHFDILKKKKEINIAKFVIRMTKT